MVVVIDRFEGNFAICQRDDMKMYNIDKSKLPREAKEGDVLVINQECIYIDHIETNIRKEKIEKLTKKLWE